MEILLSDEEYSDLLSDDLEGFHIEEEEVVADKPWKDKRKAKKRTRSNSGADWEEMQRARAHYLREWEEDMRYAKELAEESM